MQVPLEQHNQKYAMIWKRGAETDTSINYHVMYRITQFHLNALAPSPWFNKETDTKTVDGNKLQQKKKHES